MQLKRLVIKFFVIGILIAINNGCATYYSQECALDLKVLDIKSELTPDERYWVDWNNISIEKGCK